MNKINTLNTIVNEYSKYFKYFDQAKVFDVGLRFIIKFYAVNNNKSYDFLIRKFPKEDIDIIIARYRAKLHKEVKKYTQAGIKRLELYYFIPDKVYKLKMFD